MISGDARATGTCLKWNYLKITELHRTTTKKLSFVAWWNDQWELTWVYLEPIKSMQRSQYLFAWRKEKLNKILYHWRKLTIKKQILQKAFFRFRLWKKDVLYHLRINIWCSCTQFWMRWYWEDRWSKQVRSEQITKSVEEIARFYPLPYRFIYCLHSCV